jgi:DNA polymerase-3 subunit delta
MLIKSYELKKLEKNSFDYYLFYGPNIGLIENTINDIFKPIFSKNISNYDEAEIIKSSDNFKEEVFNKSFFDNEKFIIINRATDKILKIIENIIEYEPENIKIVIKSGNLEKKSKLRNFFEKKKNIIATAFYEDNHQSLFLKAQEFFREREINISNEILNLIIERSKGNRINLDNELEKVSLFSTKNKTITIKNVLKLTNLSENYDISELVDNCILINKKKTLKILNENNLYSEENILVLKTFLLKLKRLKKIQGLFTSIKDVEHIINTLKPPIFWKEKEVVKQQLKVRNLSNIKYLIKKVNDLELLIKKNSQISNQLVNNFILENLEKSNNSI